MALAVLSIAASFGVSNNFTEESRNYTTWIAANGNEYDVRIVEKSTNLPLAQRRFVASVGSPAEMNVDAGDRVFMLRIEPMSEGLRAKFRAMKGEKVDDSFDVYWDTRTPDGASGFEGKMRVGGEVKAPMVLNRLEPQYTAEAKEQRIAGLVISEVLIDRTGVVRKIRILKPLPAGLTDATVDALRQWTFQPATKNGEPVDVIFNLTVNFKTD